jgi:hypothetical protein
MILFNFGADLRPYMFRILATVLASSAALAASALPSSASSTQPTFIEGFASSVNTVAYQQPVTFTGQLVEGSARTPVSNKPVQLEIQQPGLGQYVPIATGTTGTAGQFTIITTLPSGGFVRAAFAGDTGLAPSLSNPSWGINLGATTLPSRLVLDRVPTSVSAGTPMTFSGTMEVQVNGTWQPFQGAPLTLTMEPYTSSQPNVTYALMSGAGGRFSLTEPLLETSDWIVDTTLDGAYWGGWFPDYARAYYNWIDGVSKTRIIGFSLPAKDEAHQAVFKGMYATGTVERWDGSSWVGLAYGWVQFYYRPKGTKTWRKDYSAQTDAFGHFRNIVGVHLGAGYWQVHVMPAPDTLRSTSTNTVIGTITDRTHFVSADIQRSASGSQITGQVSDVYKGLSFSTLRGLKLRLYYRSKGRRTWHAYKTTTVGLGGFFSFSAAKSYGYNFKVVLPAQSAYQSCTSHAL